MVGEAEFTVKRQPASSARRRALSSTATPVVSMKLTASEVDPQPLRRGVERTVEFAVESHGRDEVDLARDHDRGRPALAARRARQAPAAYNRGTLLVMARAFKQVDVFTTRPYYGNPVAVVLDADGHHARSDMQRFAHWTNLSETTFVLPPTEGGDYRVRIFTPNQELPFAGHPTLGTCHAWLEAGGDADGRGRAAGVRRRARAGARRRACSRSPRRR